jgi:hypothetical protein
MVALNISAGTIFGVGFVLGLIAGAVGICVTAYLVTKKKDTKEN